MNMILIAMMCGAGYRSPIPSWVHGALFSESARKIQHSRLPGSKTSSGLQPRSKAFTKTYLPTPVPHEKPHFRVFSSNIAPIPPGLLEGQRKEQQIVNSGTRFIAQGRYRDGYRFLKNYYDSHPKAQFDIASDVINAALVAGRYNHAYETIVDVATRFHLSSDTLWTQLSLATSAKGQAFPGQLQFVETRIATGLFNAGQGLIDNPYPVKTSSAKYITSASCLAMGLSSREWFSVPFLEQALRFDKQNSLAARRLVNDYDATRRFSDEARISNLMIASLKDGPEKAFFCFPTPSLQISARR